MMHPRLLSTLVLYEPVILDEVGMDVSPAKFISKRQDLWETREKAEVSLRKTFRNWDPECIKRYLQFGLRPIPTRLYNRETESNLPTSAVTLTTTKHHEAWSTAMPNLEPESAGLDRLILADWDPVTERPFSFARPECWAAMRALPFLRPSVLWVFGSRSYLSWPRAQDSKLRVTGTGVGGSGGAAQGMVEKAVLEGGSHTLVFEQINWSAENAADWIGRWFQGWLVDEELLAGYQSKRSDAVTGKASEESLRAVQNKPTKRPLKL